MPLKAEHLANSSASDWLTLSSLQPVVEPESPGAACAFPAQEARANTNNRERLVFFMLSPFVFLAGYLYTRVGVN